MVNLNLNCKSLSNNYFHAGKHLSLSKFLELQIIRNLVLKVV